MDFPRASITIPRRRLNYSAIHIPPRENDDQKPYILFLHGFPSLAVDWHGQITHFAALGYGVIAPDLLGYGSTSAPADTEAYHMRYMADDLASILDHFSITSPVYGVAHDFGVPLLIHLELYHPEKVSKLALITIGYMPLLQPFDLDKVNEMTKQALGFEGFGYQNLLVRDPDALTLLRTHHDSFTSLVFAQDSHELWSRHYAPVGALREWLRDDRKCTTIPAFTPELAAIHRAAFATSSTTSIPTHSTASVSSSTTPSAKGYQGPINWYRSLHSNQHIPDDHARLTQQQRQQRKQQQQQQQQPDATDLPSEPDHRLAASKPVLLITAGRDPLAPREMMEPPTRHYAENFRVEHVPDSGHWIMLEHPERVNRILEELFTTAATVVTG